MKPFLVDMYLLYQSAVVSRNFAILALIIDLFPLFVPSCLPITGDSLVLALVAVFEERFISNFPVEDCFMNYKQI